jgi:cobalt-zinc-cadmium efflux system membrane fusion protein
MKSLYKRIALPMILIVMGCGNSNNETEINGQESDDRIKVSKEQFHQNSMVFGTLEEKEFPTGIKVNGLIDVPPENKAVVNSIMGGYIKTIPLLVGDAVKKGQKLATLENPEFVRMQQEYMEVKEQLDYLKSEYERQNIMFKEDIISEKVFLKAESDYKRARASCNGLKKQLAMLNIDTTGVEAGHITSVINLYAPISGSITKVYVSKGSYVSPTTPILEIIDNRHVHLELSVFEKDIMKIKKDQKILFNIPEASVQAYEAKVYLVGTSIDDNRTIKVHGHPNEHGQSFLTGMFVKAEIITDTTKDMALPESAIIALDDGNYSLVLDEENDTYFYFKPLKIEVGSTVNGYTQLKDFGTLSTTDKVLAKGAFSLIGS